MYDWLYAMGTIDVGEVVDNRDGLFGGLKDEVTVRRDLAFACMGALTNDLVVADSKPGIMVHASVPLEIRDFLVDVSASGDLDAAHAKDHGTAAPLAAAWIPGQLEVALVVLNTVIARRHEDHGAEHRSDSSD